MSTIPPPSKRPGAPRTLPPPDDFDEDAPTSVVPGKHPRVDMPQEFDEGGELDDSTGDGVPAGDDDDDEEPTTHGGISRRPHPDEDEAPTKD